MTVVCNGVCIVLCFCFALLFKANTFCCLPNGLLCYIGQVWHFRDGTEDFDILQSDVVVCKARMVEHAALIERYKSAVVL